METITHIEKTSHATRRRPHRPTWPKAERQRPKPRQGGTHGDIISRNYVSLVDDPRCRSAPHSRTTIVPLRHQNTAAIAKHIIDEECHHLRRKLLFSGQYQRCWLSVQSCDLEGVARVQQLGGRMPRGVICALEVIKQQYGARLLLPTQARTHDVPSQSLVHDIVWRH
jgi:hypothetical protein